MKIFFGVILLYYFLWAQYMIEHFLEISQYTIAWINTAVITIVALLYYHCKTHSQSRNQMVEVRNNMYRKLRKLTKKYLFVLMLLLFVAATIVQIFLPAYALSVWPFFALWLITLVIARDSFWEAKIYFWRHLFLHKESVFWFSIGLLFLSIYWTSMYQPWSIIASVLIAFFVYIMLIKKAKIIRGYSIWKLFPTKIYVIAILVTTGVVLIQQQQLSITQWYEYISSLIANLNNQRIIQVEEESFSDMAIQDMYIQEESAFLVLWDEVLWEKKEDYILSGMLDNQKEQETLLLDMGIDQDSQVTFTQALTYLFTIYDVSLSTATNTRFANIATNDTRYPLFKTAHEKRLIWANINPDGLVRCDVYMVMKGIVAWWEVGSQGDVFDQYRAAAEVNNAVNGCARGTMVRGTNL